MQMKQLVLAMEHGNGLLILKIMELLILMMMVMAFLMVVLMNVIVL
jgi:hypothetical protein